ncbi:hypothetical protein F7725_014772, partial [Dissostichus mawsoni]
LRWSELISIIRPLQGKPASSFECKPNKHRDLNTSAAGERNGPHPPGPMRSTQANPPHPGKARLHRARPGCRLAYGPGPACQAAANTQGAELFVYSGYPRCISRAAVRSPPCLVSGINRRHKEKSTQSLATPSPSPQQSRGNPLKAAVEGGERREVFPGGESGTFPISHKNGL